MEENKNKTPRRHTNHYRAEQPFTQSSLRLGLGNKIWTIRKKRRLGQKQLACLMGLHSVAYLSRYERGEKLPNLINAIKLAKALSTSIGSLYPDLDAQIDREILDRRDKLPQFSELF